MLETAFTRLFSYLKSVNYAWEAITPDRLARAREQAHAYDPLVRYFGLGMDVSEDELRNEGLPEELLPALRSMRPGISRCGSVFVPFSQQGSVYIGQESFELLRLIQPCLDSFVGRSVLDLGSGSGVLSFEIAPLARRVLGLEASSDAVEWAQAAASVQGMNNVLFKNAKIGSSQAEECVLGESWDIAVFNPPMALPSSGSPRTHRDGGRLGMELPLQFLDFARRRLCGGGEVYCLVTSPIMRGKSVFFEEPDLEEWITLEKRRLNPVFNQALYRKQRYSDLGIERVELWFLHLRKRF